MTGQPSNLASTSRNMQGRYDDHGRRFCGLEKHPAGKAAAVGGQKSIGTVMTMSEKGAWPNQTICVTGGEGEANPGQGGAPGFNS